jgi:hypothetical protein
VASPPRRPPGLGDEAGRVNRETARERLETALADHGCSVRGNAAQCPGPDHANGDRRHSLSIGNRRDGQGVIVNCHLGCHTDVILEALGMSGADLFDELRERQERRVVAEYDYTDEHGEVLFRKVRYEPKDFTQYRTVNGRKVYRLGDVRRVLYRLPAVLAAVAEGRTVYVAEGEKDVHALEAAGEVATCNFDGAAKDGQRPKWRPEYGDVLRGAVVVIVADRDEPGRAHAAAIAADLAGKARSVRVVEAAEGKDAADHLAAGRTLAELADVDLSAGSADSAPEDNPVAERLGQLRAALLDSAALDSVKPPQAVVDGLLYRDGIAWLYGKPATYKSFIALDWAGCVSVGLPWHEHEVTQGPVLYLIAEGTAGLRKRVRAWEDYTDCTMLVTFLPVAVQLLNAVDLAAFVALVADTAPALVVIDTQARVTVGADENSTREMGELVAAADRIRRACGACVLIVHHEPRGGENMRGSIALEGAATSLFRADRDGSRITLQNVRQRDVIEADDVVLHAAPRLESVVLDSNAGDWRPARPSDSERQILQVLSELFLETGASASALIQATKLAPSTFYNAMKPLLIKGEVISNGTRNRSHYELPPKGSLQLSPMVSNSNGSPVSNLQPPFKGVGGLETIGETVAS